jgi:hypothetical protein
MAYEAPVAGGISMQQDRQLELQAEVYKAKQRVALHARQARPKNTTKSYTKAQKEWVEFCKERGFADGEMVTEEKLVYFLEKTVLKRPIQSSRYLNARTAGDGAPIVQTLGIAGVKNYVNSIVDHWSWQQALGVNSHKNPRGHLVRALLKAHNATEDARKRKEYVDRGLHTLQDGYTKENIRAIVRYCWTGWREDKSKYRKPQAQESYLRTAVDFLLSHSMLLRGEDVRGLQLPDMFTIQMNEGPTPCWPMILMKSQGKTNQFGHIEYMGVMRHKEPLLCTISQVAFYLFYRWEFMQEPIPQFYQRQQWYNWHLLKSVQIDKEVSYRTQLDWINDVFRATNLASKKKTHSGRAGGARYAELSGVDEASIRRAGHWNQDAMSNCYLSGLPRKFLRTMAGFNPEDHGNYYIPRATISPPESLVRALWPWVDTWLSWFNRDDLDKDKGIDPELDLPPRPPLIQKGIQQIDEKDLAAQGFLRLLDQLRTVILQDSVFLQAEIPTHEIWDHSLFQRPDYKQFAQQLLLSVRTTSTPYEIQLRQALPAIADRITTAENNLYQNISSNHDSIQDSLQSLHSKVEDLISGRISFTVRANGSESSLEQSALAVDSVQSTVIQGIQLENINMLPERPQPALTALPAEMPSYKLSRTIKTVRELWMEWYEGLNGQPAIQTLEAQYGARWRPHSKERVMFGRRKIIIDEIYARTKDGTALGEAIEAVQLIQDRMRCSLAKLGEFLKQERS